HVQHSRRDVLRRRKLLDLAEEGANAVMRKRGDTDGLTPCNELERRKRCHVGLAGTGRSLDRQTPTIQVEDQPDGRLGCGLPGHPVRTPRRGAKTRWTSQEHIASRAVAAVSIDTVCSDPSTEVEKRLLLRVGRQRRDGDEKSDGSS